MLDLGETESSFVILVLNYSLREPFSQALIRYQILYIYDQETRELEKCFIDFPGPISLNEILFQILGVLFGGFRHDLNSEWMLNL